MLNIRRTVVSLAALLCLGLAAAPARAQNPPRIAVAAKLRQAHAG